ncbi:hypothetical protein ACIQUD_32035 [Streptomyces globisporus]|uniref:hypothetical protein n=1 Tax=Streptomyces globisporus TaxID=1908 RepID=UPI00382F6AE6
MKPVTADQFAELLRRQGCCVQLDRSFPGAVYMRVAKETRHGVVDLTVVFEDDRFQRAFAPWLGQHRRRWPKFRTMSGVRRFLEIPDTSKERR